MYFECTLRSNKTKAVGFVLVALLLHKCLPLPYFTTQNVRFIG